MPSIEDWINNPLGIIQSILDKQEDKGKGEETSVQGYFKEKLKARNSITWIPSLNDTSLHNLKANSLVRYRCMVQDMFDPEFYLGKYEVKDKTTGQSFMRSGQYKDVAECGANQSIDLDSKNNVTMDRMTLYCVPVPGEAEWVKTTYSNMSKVKSSCYPSTSSAPPRNKRNLDEETVESSQSETLAQDQAKVAGIESEANDVAMETDEAAMKRQQTSKTGSAKQSAAPDLNFPLPGESGPACLVKVYDDIDRFKVNDIVEFIGVLSVDPILARFGDDSEEEGLMMEESEEEKNAHAPPPSLVPRLHAVVCNHLKHVNPLLPSLADENKLDMEGERESLLAVRQELLSVLEHVVFGDKMAAKYLLCHLLASVYGRADAMPLGKFCVNLTNCPASPVYAELLHHLLSNLVTQSHILHMSLDNMNKMAFCPKKDYKANRLCSGLLQLGDQTNLVINETALQPGQLDVNGVKNIQALGNMISWQKVEYDFDYHRQDFRCNISALVLSEGRSLLPSDCQVPLTYGKQPQNLREHFQQLDEKLTEDFLVKCRTYIGYARHLDYTLSDEMQKTIQDNFVSLRRDDPKKMTVDDFHALLSLTRLLSLSELKSCPTVELWNMAKVMENCRKQRVAELPHRQ